MLFKKRKYEITKRIDKANALFDTFKRNEAFEEFFKLAKEFPDNSDVLFGLAILYNSSRQEELAIDILKRILILDNKHESTKCVLPTLIYEYAVQLSETGKKELAIKYLLDFIELDNNNKSDLANGYKELAIIEESLGNKANAKNFIEKAIDVNASNKNDECSETNLQYFRDILDRLNGC
jgi:tetratricopeptide (TPR) repeat protein